MLIVIITFQEVEGSLKKDLFKPFKKLGEDELHSSSVSLLHPLPGGGQRPPSLHDRLARRRVLFYSLSKPPPCRGSNFLPSARSVDPGRVSSDTSGTAHSWDPYLSPIKEAMSGEPKVQEDVTPEQPIDPPQNDTMYNMREIVNEFDPSLRKEAFKCCCAMLSGSKAPPSSCLVFVYITALCQYFKIYFDYPSSLVLEGSFQLNLQWLQKHQKVISLLPDQNKDTSACFECWNRSNLFPPSVWGTPKLNLYPHH
ncbi:hypothetical protein J6590_033434 [Homalodisca vitripennis]|nr:hypothetical protein J6590_033434 [Homalodisca vitripennis]